MLSESRKILFCIYLLGQIRASVAEICSLCETPYDLPQRWTYRLASGETCQELYIRLGSLSPSSSDCLTAKSQSQELCCGDAEPDPVVFPPTAPPAFSEVGTNIVCNICGTTEYPGLPSAWIRARYVGDYTCSQLYYRGLANLIPSFMCAPLRDFAYDVCGCGEYNPACQSNPAQCFGGSSYAPPPAVSPAASTTTSAYAPSFDRREPSSDSKTNSRISRSSGGAAGRLRGNRDLEVLVPDESGVAPVESEFASVEGDFSTVEGELDVAHDESEHNE